MSDGSESENKTVPDSDSESATPKAEAIILNFSTRAQEIRTKVREEHGLVSLNIDEDSRFATMVEESRQNLMPRLSEFEQKYADYVKEPIFFLGQEARDMALKQFEIQNPEEYKSYARYGVYLDSDGNPDSSGDPFVKKIDFDVEEEMRNTFLDIKKQHADPNQAISAIVKSYSEVHMRAADKVYTAFREGYPEKTLFYNSPDLYVDQYLTGKMNLDPSARHKVALEEESDLAQAIHYVQVLRILGKDAPKTRYTLSDRLKNWWGQ